MFLKPTNLAAALLIATTLTGCSTTSRTSAVHTTSTYYSPAYRSTPQTTIISKTKAYHGYKPKYAPAPSQSIYVNQEQKIKNKVIHNQVVQNNASYYPHTHPYAKPPKYHKNRSYAPTTPSTPGYQPYTSNAPYTSDEQAQINEAKRRSLETKSQEDAWNNRLDAAEEHQMQQALMNSYETKAAEDAARSNSSWLDSTARTSTPSAYDSPPSSADAYGNDTKASVESAAWVDDNRQLQQAMDASLQTQAAEDAARQQSLIAEENRQLQQAMDASLQTHASIEQPNAPIAMEQPVAWVTNEGIQVQAGEKLMELKRNNGGVSPSHADMKAHLQREMNLSESQSRTVLDELGIE